jgi:hypothetical protein
MAGSGVLNCQYFRGAALYHPLSAKGNKSSTLNEEKEQSP